MNSKLGDEELFRVVQVYEESGRNYAEAARLLGVSRSTVQNRISEAARRGLSGAPVDQVAPGFLVDYITQNRREGEVTSEWVRISPEKLTYDEILNATEEAVMERINSLPVIPKPNALQLDKFLTVYLVTDLHLGMYSWKEETGDNYDSNIAKTLLRESMAELVSLTPASKNALIINLGDFFHSSDNKHRTERSGNHLDTDGRYAKILDIGIDLFIETVWLALSKHEQVTVVHIPGNHDEYATIALRAAIRQAFKDNPRVHVSRDPSPFYFHEFGNVLIGVTHGDMIKATDMPGVMAAYVPVAWGNTQHRYVYLGHVHHSSIGGGERHGAIWETFRTLAGKDSWTSKSGYASGRSMVAITHHKDTGEKFRNTVTISGPGFKQKEK